MDYHEKRLKEYNSRFLYGLQVEAELEDRLRDIDNRNLRDCTPAQKAFLYPFTIAGYVKLKNGSILSFVPPKEVEKDREEGK